MKRILLMGIMGFWLMLALSVPAQTVVTVQPTPAQAIVQVLTARAHARLNSMRIVIDDGKIVSVQLHPIVYLKALQKIDVSACPDDFRTSWDAYVQSWRRKLGHHVLKENAAEALPMGSGDMSALPDFAKRETGAGTDAPWQNCERAAREFGVDAAQVDIH